MQGAGRMKNSMKPIDWPPQNGRITSRIPRLNLKSQHITTRYLSGGNGISWKASHTWHYLEKSIWRIPKSLLSAWKNVGNSHLSSETETSSEFDWKISISMAWRDINTKETVKVERFSSGGWCVQQPFPSIPVFLKLKFVLDCRRFCSPSREKIRR